MARFIPTLIVPAENGIGDYCKDLEEYGLKDFCKIVEIRPSLDTATKNWDYFHYSSNFIAHKVTMCNAILGRSCIHIVENYSAEI